MQCITRPKEQAMQTGDAGDAADVQLLENRACAEFVRTASRAILHAQKSNNVNM